MTFINDALNCTIQGPLDMFKHLFNLNLTLQGLPSHDLIHPSRISLAMPPQDMFILVHCEAGMVGKRIYYLNHSELSLLANVSGSEPQPGTILENTGGLNCHQITVRKMQMANYWATLTTTFYKVSFFFVTFDMCSVFETFVNLWIIEKKPIAERTFYPINVFALCISEYGFSYLPLMPVSFTKWLGTQIRHWYCKWWHLLTVRRKRKVTVFDQ